MASFPLVNNREFPARFVINTIAYVDDKNYDFSDSDDEYNEHEITEEEKNWVENAIAGKIDVLDKNQQPYFIDTKKVIKTVDKCCEDVTHETSIPCKTKQITNFLQNLKENGFEMDDERKYGIKNCVAATIGLNRMESVSIRKNTVLSAALNEKVESDICHNFFAFHWKPVWRKADENEENVTISTVRNFYKYLKKQSKELAANFLFAAETFEEPEKLVPYRYLREHTRKHEKSEALVKKWRKKEDEILYFHIVDFDTQYFNGIYSAYFKILNEGKIPTVMSTGYEFGKVGRAFELAIELDRKIRAITNEYFPGGVYFPEPNTCILFENGKNILQESFINSKNKFLKVRETPALLTNLNKNRNDAIFIFSMKNPIITALPRRFKKFQKNGKLVLLTDNVSIEYLEMGASPLETDLVTLQNLCQSHFNIDEWWENLFINGCIPAMKNVKEALQELVKGKDEKLTAITKQLSEKDVETVAPIFGDVMLAHANAVVQFKEHLAKRHRSDEEQSLSYMK